MQPLAFHQRRVAGIFLSKVPPWPFALFAGAVLNATDFHGVKLGRGVCEKVGVQVKALAIELNDVPLQATSRC